MAVIYVAEDRQTTAVKNPEDRSVILEADGYYWFLYRYFEGANLNRRSGELIGLYDDAEIDGYQLYRLECELKSAAEDIRCKPERWRVLTGWNERPTPENEIWCEVERDKMIRLIEELLWLTEFARGGALKLICSGD
jgi:hypothetical protein